MSVTAERRDWSWDVDGELVGLYVETREVVVKNGPSAGKSKLVFDFHTGLDDDSVSVWETAVLRTKFGNELRSRRSGDFEPGERITITPMGKREGANGVYRDFAVDFEHAAPKRSTAELLAADDEDEDDDDGIPFP